MNVKIRRATGACRPAVAIAMVVATFCPLAAHAASATWSGANSATNTNWSNNLNWVGNTLPTFNNTLDVVYSSPTQGINPSRIGPSGNLANPIIRSWSLINADSTVQLQLTNSDGTINRFLVFDTDGNDGFTTAQVSIDAQSAGNVSITSGTGVILNDDLTIAHDGSGTFTISTPIVNGSGTAASLIKTGTGTLILSAANTYTGASHVSEGVLRISAANRLADTSSVVVKGGTFDLQTFNDTVGAVTISSGSIIGTGTLTGSSYALQGGAVNANLGAGPITVSTGTTMLSGSAASTGITISSGRLTLGANDRLVNSGTVVLNGGSLHLGSFSDTIGSFTMTAGALDGTGTLTTSTYALQGGAVNANLGAGSIAVTTGTTTLSGSTASTGIAISSGRLALGADHRLANTGTLTLTGGSLDLGLFADTVATVSTSANVTLAFSGSAGTVGALTTTGNLSLAANDTLAVTFLAAPTQATYTLLTYQGTRTGTFDTLTLSGSVAAGSFNVTYGGASNGTIGLQQKANQAATFTMAAAAARALVNSSVAVSGTLANTSFSGAVPLAVSGSSVGQLTVAGLTTGSTIAGGAAGVISGTIQTGSTVGQRTWSVTNTDAVAITPTATASGSLTVVDQRTFTVGTPTVALGSYLRGLAATTGSTSVSSTGLFATTASGTLGAFSGVGGFGLTLVSGSPDFSGALGSQTATYALSGSAAAAGVISGTFFSTVAAELGQIQPVTVAITGTAYDAASLTRVQNSAVGAGGAVSVTNAAGSFRSSAFVSGSSLLGTGWSVTGYDGGSVVAGGTLAGVASFDGTGLLSGLYMGTFTATFQNDQALAGAGANDLGTLTWDLATSHVNTSGSGSRTLAAGVPLATNLGLTAGPGLNATVASFAAGITGSAATISMAFTAPTDPDLLSSVLDLQGTAGVPQVLELSYDPGGIGNISAQKLYLAWFNPATSQWVNAVAGNTANFVTLSSPFLGSWSEYLAANPSQTVGTALGAYGVDADTNTVWAAIDHNSEFAVIPEPSTNALLAVAAGAVALRVGRRRAWKMARACAVSRHVGGE